MSNKKLIYSEILTKYNTGKYKYKDLAKEYNFSSNGIRLILKKMGAKLMTLSESNRKYSLNENYFETIDTEDKAYFLGLMYADGYNQVSKNVTRLSLQQEDRHILEQFKKQINSNKPLSFIDRNSKNPKHKNMLSVIICSHKISQDLKKMGCGQKKSFDIRLPNSYQVPDLLMRHFIRGFFDGDGCISLKKHTLYREHHRFFLCSNFEFLTQLQDYLVKTLNISKTKLQNRINIYQLTNAKKSDINKIYHYLYDGANFYLKRKKSIFDTKPFYNRRSNYRSKYINVSFFSNCWCALYRDLNNKRKQKRCQSEEDAALFLKSIGQFKEN